MIDLSAFKNKRFAVMGLGMSGLVAGEALCAGGAEVIAWDDSESRRSDAETRGVPIVRLDDVDWMGVEALILSPGIPHTHPKPNPVALSAKEAGVAIVGDVELLFRTQPKASFVGVTGTNGKSTTTALISHILNYAGRRCAAGGNLGLPALSLEPLGSEGIYVLEMSSYQLELTPSARFEVAILLNISQDHLDRHGGMNGYVSAKRRIFAQQEVGDVAIVGVDDQEALSLLLCLSAERSSGIVPISTEREVGGGVYSKGSMLIDASGAVPREVCSLADIEALPGSHNAQNAAAAYAAVRAVGVTAEIAAAALETYPGLPHRQQLAAIIDGVRYINDSKATNPEAAAKALSSYEKIYWIAGGRAKEGSLEALFPYISRVNRAFLIGEAAEQLANQLSGLTQTELCGDLQCAVNAAGQAAVGEKAVVLLSPACASHDQFVNFEQRGEMFCRLAAQRPGIDRDIRYGGKAS
ncbi:MAG: UDP-N-acetylmuramoyl-L-alanine--D-glutamate ligase [Pseudomonadota bacterium]|nr:UDP-N-acetylmuramoyl-L-alanine--D-glutamate ligase [Pseudomonadota bacterium]